eukprot:8320744-Pyramimonas_sp.AAC.1
MAQPRSRNPWRAPHGWHSPFAGSGGLRPLLGWRRNPSGERSCNFERGGWVRAYFRCALACHPSEQV